MAGSGDDCEWQERLQEWIDGDLGAGESEAVLAHAARCASCGEQMNALRAIHDQLATCLPRTTLDDEFNRRVLMGVDSASTDVDSARAHLEGDRRAQEAALIRRLRRIYNWTILDLVGILLLTGLATTVWQTLPDVSAWLDREFALTDYSPWLVCVSLASLSTVVAFAIVRLLATTEHVAG